MEKLVERETATRDSLAAAPALAVQFFLIPLAVVGLTVMVYVGFRSMLVDSRTASDYLAEIRTGGMARQWSAAYELSRLMNDPAVRADGSLAPALVNAFEQAANDDPRVRRYLAQSIGRLDPPLPAYATVALIKSLDQPETHKTPDLYSRMNGWTEVTLNEVRIPTIWALASSGDASVVPKLIPWYESSDAGIRKVTVYALGALPGEAQLATLRTALQDPAADVRWNAAVALARHGSHDGVSVLRQMLDRAYVQGTVTRVVRQDDDEDPIADVMISGLRAAAVLKESTLKSSVTELSQHDRSMRVRQAAIEALKVMG